MPFFSFSLFFTRFSGKIWSGFNFSEFWFNTVKGGGILNKKGILVERRYLQPFSRKLLLKVKKWVDLAKMMTHLKCVWMSDIFRQNHPFFQPLEAIFSKTAADIVFQQVYFFCFKYHRLSPCRIRIRKNWNQTKFFRKIWWKIMKNWKMVHF